MLNVCLNDVLTADHVVTTKILNYPDWITNRIIRISNENIHIEFNDEYLKLLLTVGDSIKIKYQHDEFEYTLIGFVENVIFTTPPQVIVRVENIISHENIRKFIRWNINLLCRILPSNDEFKIQGITTDISEGGFSMVSYADFNITDIVDVEIISSHNDILKFRGNIKRLESKIKNQVQYGIEIVEIDNNNEQILNKIITSFKK